MAQGELSREVAEGLARAAGIDLKTVPLELLVSGEMTDIWRGIARLNAMSVEDELPAFLVRLEEGRRGQ